MLILIFRKILFLLKNSEHLEKVTQKNYSIISLKIDLYKYNIDDDVKNFFNVLYSSDKLCC